MTCFKGRPSEGNTKHVKGRVVSFVIYLPCFRCSNKNKRKEKVRISNK
jgi:hypothetical protein